MRNILIYIVFLAVWGTLPASATQFCRKTVVRAAQTHVPLPVDLATTFSQSPRAPHADTYFILDGQLFVHQMIADGPAGESIFSARRKVIVTEPNSNEPLMRRWKSVSVVRSAHSLLPVLALLADNGEAFLCRASSLPPDFYADGTSRISSDDDLEEHLLSQFVAHPLTIHFHGGQKLPLDKIKLVAHDDDTFRVGVTAVFGIFFQSEDLPLTAFAKGLYRQPIEFQIFTETRGTLDFVPLPSGGAVLLTAEPAIVYLNDRGYEIARDQFSPDLDLGNTIAAVELPRGPLHEGPPDTRTFVFVSENSRHKLVMLESGKDPRTLSLLPEGEEPLSLSYSMGPAPLVLQEDRGVGFENINGGFYKTRLVVITRRSLESGPVYRFLAHQFVNDQWSWVPLPWNPLAR